MSKPAKIRIKLISRGRDGSHWARQLPESGSFTGQCSFHFNPSETDYDWFVVVDDISRRLTAAPETLRCTDENTLLVTTEPPTITRYGKGFCSQFANVLTSQPQSALPHPSRIETHTGNFWFSGRSYAELLKLGMPEKTKVLSTVCSSKQQKHTIHNDRYRFCHWLMEQIPEADLFGHGSRFIKNKYDALEPYRYHLAIENYAGPHHWTEKMADAYISGCFPIYYGCTNIGDYFPEESFLAIDIFNRDEAFEKIRSVIGDRSHYDSCKEAMVEARRRVMTEYNLIYMIEKMALARHSSNLKPSGRQLYGRKQMRVRRPGDALSLAVWHLKRHLK